MFRLRFRYSKAVNYWGLLPLCALAIWIIFPFEDFWYQPGEYELKYYNRSLASISKLRENTECNLPELDPFERKMRRYFRSRFQRSDCSEFPAYFQSEIMSNNDPLLTWQSFPVKGVMCCYEILNFTKKHPFGLESQSNQFCQLINQKTVYLPEGTEFVLGKCIENKDLDELSPTVNITAYLHSAKTSHQEILTFVPKPPTKTLPPSFNPIQRPSFDNSQSTRDIPQSRKMNVIILALDGVPRMNFIRLMRRTYTYLTKNLKAIDLHGFSKVGDATLVNSFALLMGLNYTEVRQQCWKEDSASFDSCPWIWKNYSKHGYTTLFAEDYKSVFQYHLGGFQTQPTDYYLYPFSNWLSSKVTRKHFGSKHCLRSTPVLEMIVRYAKQASWALRDTPSFQLYWAGLVNFFPSDPFQLDDAVVELLKSWAETGILQRSLIIILSDHGWRTGNVMRLEQTQIENKMPFAFIHVPKVFREAFPEAYKNLKENQWRLTTPFDIHATLLDILDSKRINRRALWDRSRSTEVTRKAVSLFLPIPKNRNCQMADIDETWCVCGDYKAVATDSEIATELAEVAVQTINDWLKPFPICWPHTLERIIKAEERVGPGSESYLKDKKIYRLSIQVKPKAARFQVVVFKNGEQVEMSKEVFRLNTFQRACETDYNLLKVCTCNVTLDNAFPYVTV